VNGRGSQDKNFILNTRFKVCPTKVSMILAPLFQRFLLQLLYEAS